MKLSPSLRVTGRVCVFLSIITLIFLSYFSFEIWKNGIRYIHMPDGQLFKKSTPVTTLIFYTAQTYTYWFSSWFMAIIWCVVHGLFAIASFNWLRKGRFLAVGYMLVVGIAASLVGMFCASVLETRYQEIFCGRPSHIYVPDKPAASSRPPEAPFTRP